MAEEPETLEQIEALVGQGPPAPVPGLVLVWSGDRPRCVPLPVPPAGLVLGRGLAPGPGLGEDGLISRRHALVTMAEGGGFAVSDLGSRNGTHLDGRRLTGPGRLEPGTVLRLGGSLFLAEPDLGPVLRHPVRREADGLIGPRTRAVLTQIERAARTSCTMLVLGESGTGKELAARRYHAASPRAAGPFLAINCATIPEGIAERLLFGARRGAYTGVAAHADGHLQAAHGGTLFLDEVAELDLAVQAKLLRVLETREVIPLGGSRGQRVELGICAATLRGVPALVAAGKFREDLYYRLGPPAPPLPPLRQRPEEIGHFVEQALAALHPALPADPGLVEACLGRPWPGNVRELLAEVRRAGQATLDQGRPRVLAAELDPRAGRPVGASAAGGPAPVFPGPGEIALCLRRENGNVTRAARLLGLHRNQLRRWLERERQPPAGAPGGADRARPSGSDGADIDLGAVILHGQGAGLAAAG